MLAYKRFLGYTKGVDGTPEIVEDEAITVRLIYQMFLQGQTPSSIAKWLTANEIPTPGGKVVWQSGVVKSILTNEKYCGNAYLQKSITVDFMTKKTKKNTGEAPQYFVESSHPPIIPVHVFELAQAEFTNRKLLGHTTSSMSCFANHIVCGTCGQFFGRKLWHSTDKYRCTVWRCNGKYEKEKAKCRTAETVNWI